jgi:SAM-dependent methyltransferase
MSSTHQHPAPVPAAVIWHELECGGYEIDLALWLELAARAAGPVLDIGAGTGRVARVLARAGHSVTALERDQLLLDALRSRARGLDIECVQADARAFSLERREFGLCIVPMHTVQLLGDRKQRAAFLRCAKAHLRARGLLALALLPDAEPFDCGRGHLGPAPESARVGGMRFISTPTRVAVRARSIVIERERSILPLMHERASRATSTAHDRVELTRLSADDMLGEVVAAGFSPAATRHVPATDEHVGSEVVVAHA